MRRTIVVFLSWVMLAAAVRAEEATSPIGRKVANFVLRDYRGKSHALADYADRKLMVLAFLGTECPLAKLYGPRLEALSHAYADRGVAFLGINANSQDSITEIASYARVHGITFPVLKDVGNRVADRLRAVRTPEVFLLDRDRIIRYWGRIDDQYGISYARDKPLRLDLKIAIDELLAGKPVSQPVAASVGCHIGRIRNPKPDSPVTYSNQIARLLQKRCVECHRPGEIAPFSLTDYDAVAGWSEMILEVVHQRRMPPWHASGAYGRFANDRRLSDQEIKLLERWFTDGAPEGDPANLPKSIAYVHGWQLPRKPDMIIPMRNQPYHVPAEGAVEYQYFTVDPGFTEDKWVTMDEILPGNRAVVHHVLVFVRQPGQHRSKELIRGVLAAYVPGVRSQPLPAGMAKRIPAGSQLVFQVHYTPNGSPQEDTSVLGLVFTRPEDVSYQVITTEAIETDFTIPPHAENYRVEATSGSHGGPLLLLSMSPHMHLRGKSFRYEALYPDGSRDTLLDVPHYDFNWQTTYRLAAPKRLPPGTRIHCVAHYDNSEDNLGNPDPEKTIRWGDQTWDEMMIGFFDVALPFDASHADARTPDFRPSVADRARQLVKRFDANGDGQIARNEVPARVGKLFDRLDRDHNDRVTVAEIEQALKRQHKRN